jgi:hypothetical protein
MRSVGMNLFGSVKYGQFLSEDANFSTFYLSMLTLFRWVLARAEALAVVGPLR